jgi:S-formylglutathione hydrolase FrmB
MHIVCGHVTVRLVTVDRLASIDSVLALHDNHASSQVRKSCTAHKDSVRRHRGQLSLLVPAGRRPYNGYFSFMPLSFMSHRSGRIALLLFLGLLATAGAHSQERADCRAFHSALLGSSVRYCVYLPASYSAADAKTRKYPVLYLLHGLGGNEQALALDGEWSSLQDLRRQNMVGEFLVVAPDGWDTFYINSRDGKTPYGDFFLREFVPFIEHTYRVRPERAARGITGFSMGGYGALRMAFSHPELFGSVSEHSGALMRTPPQGVSAGASSGNLAAQLLARVFGNPIDQKFWDLNSPFVLARKNALALLKMKIYFDCGTEDSYGFYRGASELHETLDSLKIPHEFHLYPGGHSVSYLLAHRDASFEFHWREFNSTK